MPLRCYLFEYHLGSVVRWYEELPCGRLRQAFALGESKHDTWRLRAFKPEDATAVPVSWVEGQAERLG